MFKYNENNYAEVVLVKIEIYQVVFKIFLRMFLIKLKIKKNLLFLCQK